MTCRLRRAETEIWKISDVASNLDTLQASRLLLLPICYAFGGLNGTAESECSSDIHSSTFSTGELVAIVVNCESSKALLLRLLSTSTAGNTAHPTERRVRGTPRAIPIFAVELIPDVWAADSEGEGGGEMDEEVEVVLVV